MTNRRRVLIGLMGSALTMAGIGRAMSQPFIDAGAFGLEADSGQDQTRALQMAVDAAAELRQPLYLAAGTYEINNVAISRAVTIQASGQVTLRQGAGDAIFTITDCQGVVLEGIGLDGGVGAQAETALLSIINADRVSVRDCRFSHSRGHGIKAHKMLGAIENCQFEDIADTGIFSMDSDGLDITSNSITRCGNGGIRLWRSESGADGSRVWGNRISEIDWVAGGNGQNGNGINVFRADGVDISGNHIAGCAFSAVRLNATNNTRVTGNYCFDSGEVSIFSEFGFSGSIISNNLIEGGAAGISMTNFDSGGRLSVCQGNIVRNLAQRSRTNPDTVPYGIAAEADAVVSGNVVEAVPGTGIVVGWGPYLRDVLVSDNLVRNCKVGIAASVAPGAGHASISNNLVSGSDEHAIVGAQWDDIVSTDLLADSARYPHIAIEGNSIV